MNQRIEWIDLLKGIGILFVVAGHSALSPSFVGYIFSFHMPLFFFLSGYLFSAGKYPDFKSFLGKKARSLLVPYFSFALVSMVLIFLMNWFLLGAGSDIPGMVGDTLVSTRNSIAYNNPLWFLTALFCLESIYYLLRRFLSSKVLLVLAVLFLSVLGFRTSGSPILPWTFDSAMYFLVFYAIGNLMKEKSLDGKGPDLIRQLMVFAVVLVGVRQIWELFVFEVGFLTSGLTYIGRYFLYAVGPGMFGIAVYALVSQWLGRTKWPKAGLSYLGRNSLIIMALHYPLFYLFDLVNNLTLGLPPSNGLGLLKTAVALCLLVPVIGLINRYMPFILGKPRQRDVVR